MTDIQDQVWKTNTLSLTKNFCCQTLRPLENEKEVVN